MHLKENLGHNWITIILTNRQLFFFFFLPPSANNLHPISALITTSRGLIRKYEMLAYTYEMLMHRWVKWVLTHTLNAHTDRLAHTMLILTLL